MKVGMELNLTNNQCKEEMKAGLPPFIEKRRWDEMEQSVEQAEERPTKIVKGEPFSLDGMLTAQPDWAPAVNGEAMQDSGGSMACGEMKEQTALPLSFSTV
jgi:hypothetical protein